MTNNEAERMLSRRERRRLQELQDPQHQESAPEAEVVNSVEETDAAVSEIDETEIFISPYDEDGNLRSRREIRELRQQALDKLRSERGENPEDDEAVDPSDVPTEALSLEELEEIAQAQHSGTEPQPVPAEDSADDAAEFADHKADTADETAERVLDPVDEETVKEPEVPTAPEETYSFPDIKPLEEDQPVFDDPSSRTITESTSGTEEPALSPFDDVIERAVADESASVHKGSSSLILPEVPETDSLTGPIGATGELFVTGSIELPKSLGETGGHVNLQDSIASKEGEDDPVEILELSSLYEASEFDSAPISAKQAVSSRSSEKSGTVTPEVQKDGKKSIALALTGGGLLLVLVAGGIWLFTSGYFG